MLPKTYDYSPLPTVIHEAKDPIPFLETKRLLRTLLDDLVIIKRGMDPSSARELDLIGEAVTPEIGHDTHVPVVAPEIAFYPCSSSKARRANLRILMSESL
mmetsp:Transcript_3642/g.8192  ORF Transcript_3642/g.8192 Transcript_3642/m.8192 type:complete len:101 (-) Transcript_3642:547-849(-)